MNLNLYDYIVIGSGPSGLLVNGELANANLRGICLEKGDFVSSNTSDIYTPKQILKGYSKKGLNLLIGLPPLLLTEGECIGGGSTVNSSLHHRTPSYIWNKWIVKYGLKNLDYENALKLYEELEDKFSSSIGNSQLPEFYKNASKVMKVQRIPRWGFHNKEGFERKTAYDVIKEYYPKSISNIKTRIEVLKIVRENTSSFKVVCRDIASSKTAGFKVFRSKYLFLCAGAGNSPQMLSSLGYSHKRLGCFKVHPTARISLVPYEEQKYSEVVEPFQITEYFPELMIGSSANRKFLSEINYPYKNNLRDFYSCLNLYSMAPSDNSGRIITKGLFKGLRFYSLSKEARTKIKFGLKKIIEISSMGIYSHAFSPAGEINLKSSTERNLDKFLESTINKTLSSVHIFSSASCGENLDLCPVRSDGSVPNIKGLFVMDSSVIPSCPTVNPQSTVAVFALNMIRQFLKS